MNSTIVIHDASPDGLPVVTGCPFRIPHDEDTPSVAVVTTDDGTAVPAQCHTLAPSNPDGIQWVELSFLATSSGAAQVHLGGTLPGRDLASTRSNEIAMANDRLRAVLSAEPGAPPLTLHVPGGTDQWEQAGHLSPEIEDGEGVVYRDTGATARSLHVLRSGPLRARAELCGQLAGPKGQPHLSYRLTVELWRRMDVVRVDWMLTNMLPGIPEVMVKRAALVGDWDVGNGAARCFVQQNHGDYFRQRLVSNPDPVTIVADLDSPVAHVAAPAMLLDDSTYARYLPAPTTGTLEWLAVAGDRRSVAVTVADFTATLPNALRSEDTRLSYDFIPEGHDTHWPQGRRREQTVAITITGPALNSADITDKLAGAPAFGRAQPTPATLADTQSFDIHTALPHERGRNVRVSAYLSSLCNLNTPADKWDLGDTIDTHYTRGYPSQPNRLEMKNGAPPMRPEWRLGGYLPAYMANFVEPVWTNNEYDVIHALAQETCRSGSNAHAGTLRHFARHNIEVDFISYSDDRWHDKASPAHSAHHNTTGAYPSHFWTQGLLQYYLLSGDHDALAVALALGDKTIECLHDPDVTPALKFDRELGWGLLLLACLVEVTGEKRFLAECTRLVDFLVTYDRKRHTGQINLSAGDARKCFDRQVIDCAFGYGALVEAVDRYQKLTQRRDVHDWLCAFLNDLKQFAWERVEEGGGLGLAMLMMAIGFERTGDPDFLDVAMTGIDALFGPLGNMGTPLGEAKPSASTYRSLHRVLGHADRAGLLGPYEVPALRHRRERREGTALAPGGPPAD